jgi:hypothetical protein
MESGMIGSVRAIARRGGVEQEGRHMERTPGMEQAIKPRRETE